MLQNKDITEIQEIKMFFKDSWTTLEFFKEYLDLFKINKTSKIFKSVKSTGVTFSVDYKLRLQNLPL